MPLCRPCNLSSSIVQSARKEKSRGVLKEHELYSDSYRLKGRPHQLHPLLGCHRALEKRSWFLHLLSIESLFSPLIPPLPSPAPFTFVEPEVAWSQEKTENSVAEKNWNRVFFILTFTYSTLFLKKLVIYLSNCVPTPPLTLILVLDSQHMRYANESK